MPLTSKLLAVGLSNKLLSTFDNFCNKVQTVLENKLGA